MGMTLTFPAMRGKMGGAVYYVAMVPARNIPNLFESYLERKHNQSTNKEDLDLQTEAQRRMNLKRIPAIADYILDSVQNRTAYGYVFSSITANSEAGLEFEEAIPKSNLGQITVENFEKFTVADGQHRLAGMKAALKKLPREALDDECLTVVFFDVRDPSTGKVDIKRKHQIFTDLNRSTQKMTGSLLVGMGNEPNELITRKLVEEMPFFNELVEMERASPTKNSDYLFSLQSIKQTVDSIIGTRTPRLDIPEGFDEARKVWEAMVECMPIWQQVAQKETDPRTVKTSYVCSHAVVVRSLAVVVHRICELATTSPQQARAAREAVKKMNWRKSNPWFRSRILDEGDSIINNKTSQRNLIKGLLVKFSLEDAAV